MLVTDTLILTKEQISQLLTIEECMDAVEKAFKLYSEGKTQPPKIMGIHVDAGGFHTKAGILDLSRKYFVVKTNANFPLNTPNHKLPTIQGIIAVFDGNNGRLLALMDSIEITIIRTGAATGIAAKYLSLENSKTITICGCGNQGKISLKAISKVRQIQNVYAYDTDPNKSGQFAKEFEAELNVIPIELKELGNSLRQSQIIVTCTTSKQPFIFSKDIAPGTFIAAVGADSEDKHEISPGLFSTSKIIVDHTEQAASIGDLHHAIASNTITLENIHAELGMIIAGKKRGRESENEVIIFDSTGIALQDVASASIVFEKALSESIGLKINFSH